MKKRTFKARTQFVVDPAKWKSMSAQEVASMFDAFFDWMVANEESMTFAEAETAWNTVSEWAKYLEDRNATALSRNYAYAI